jgi:hypothetical protein
MTTLHSIKTLSDESATALTPTVIHSGLDVTIQNINSEGYVYVGGESVTTESYGFRILPNHSISFELSGRDFLYATCSDNGMQVATITIGLEIGD